MTFSSSIMHPKTPRGWGTINATGQMNPRRKYLLLLHDSVRSHIASLGKREKRRLREKLEFLQHGMWDAGVRVKKLRDGRSTFEARLTRSDRILFTLSRPPQAATRIYVWGVVKHDDVTAAQQRIIPANAPFLDFQADRVEQLPDLDVDDLSDEHFGAPFEQPRASAPDRTGLDGGGDVDAGPQRWQMVDDEEWRRLLTAEEPDSLRLYLFLTEEQARLVRCEPPVLLSGTAGSGKTTIAVYYLLRHRARQLVDGSVGADDGPDAATAAPAAADSGPGHRERALFVTCSDHLKRFSERIYRGLVAATDLEAAPDAVHFTTFGELLRDVLADGILPDRGTTGAALSAAGLSEFRAIFGNHPYAARYDAELVWEEIRSIIKGAKPPVSRRRFAELAARFDAQQATARERAELAEYLVRLGNLELGAKLDSIRERRSAFTTLQEFAASVRDPGGTPHAEQRMLLESALRLLDKQAARLDRPLMTLREYEGLGRKRAPNFPFDRQEIHRIAEYYQDRLEHTSRHDEMDLTRAALQHLDGHGDRFRYDLVVCDEVQDFTDMQLAMLFRLATDPLRTVLTGDPKQIINPSGFRWEEVRARYYERGLPVPDVIDLSINFRSVGNIVALANGLLALKRALVGVTSGEIAERWMFRGRPPLVIDGVSEQELLGTIRLSGAGQAVLVRTPAERDRLRASLDTEFVFTINDAKGLEFDAVLLWRFADDEDSSATWRRIAQQRDRGERDRPHIRHEINLLYVAVTRARNTLLIWDGPRAAAIWTIDRLADHVFRSADTSAVSTLWQRVSTPAEWAAQGDYFLDREHYAAAEECYRNAQEHAKEELARAYRLEQAGDHRQAADLFARHGRADRAAENLERHAAFTEAARAWRRAGAERRALICEARHFETVGRHTEAAARWQRLGDTERMVDNWELAGEHRLLAEHYLREQRRGDAARHLQLAGDHAAAAVEFRRAGLPADAAREFERAGDYRRAVPLYRRLHDQEGVLRCHLQAGEHHDAGLLYEKRGDIDRAIDCFRTYAQGSPSNRRDLEQRLAAISPKRPGLKAAARLNALDRLQEAARIFERRKGHLARAIDLHQRVGAHAEAAACMARSGRFQDAAGEAVLAGTPASVTQAVGYLSRYVLDTWQGRVERVDQIARSGRRLRTGGQHHQALAHFLALQDVYGRSEVAATYVDDVCRAYAHLDHHEEAIRYFVDNDGVTHAMAYLDARPDLVLPLDVVDRMVRNDRSGHVDCWYQAYDAIHLMARLLHRGLYRGEDADRRERIATILLTMPGHFGFILPVFHELGEMLIELRLCNPIVCFVGVRRDDYGAADPAERERRHLLDAFCMRLARAAAATGDPELTLCTLLGQPEALDAGLATVQPTMRNYLLFERSPAHYPAAVEMLIGAGDSDEAAGICARHDDYRRAGAIREEAGDLKGAATTYRDSGHYADARRCYHAIGDEIGVARVYEREKRYDEALAIWQRRGRTRDVARVMKKLQAPSLTLDLPQPAPHSRRRR